MEPSLKERTAALNTQLRFGRERQALQEAYKMRAYIQLRGAKIEDEQRELQRVEKVIAELETRKMSGIQKLIKSIIDTAKASLNPEVDDESTLLDQFRSGPRPAALDLDEVDLDEVEELPVEEEPYPEASPPKPAPAPETETSHWGSEGYSYDDKF